MLRRDPPETLYDACALFAGASLFILIGASALIASAWLVLNGIAWINSLVGFH